MKYKITLLILLSCMLYSNAEEIKQRDYSFTLYDGSLNLFTMRQFNEGYTSLHRMTMRALTDVLGDKKVIGLKLSKNLSFILSWVFMPFTHEEGHRSIAVHLGYGGYTVPFIDLSGKAFAKSFQPEYIPISYYRRRKAAGFESDYLMCRNDTLSAAFQSEDAEICWSDFSPRIINTTGYYMVSLIFGEIFENYDNTEKNKISSYSAGDPISLTAALFHEDVGYLYEDYSDISDEEKVFLDRIALRSLVNFVNPFMIGTPSIKISDSFSFSVFMNYSLCPFGDFIEETAAVKYNNINADIYIRQYQNKDFWFPSFGIGIRNYEFASFSVDAGFHFWMQPEELSFISSIRKPGCAGEVKLTWFIPNSKDFPIKSTGLSLGVSGKTKGFLPGYESHDNALRLSAGFTIRY